MKLKYTHIMRDFYRVYRGSIDRDPVNYKEFSKIIKAFGLELKQEVFNSTIVNLPYFLGKVYIRKTKLSFVFDENGKIDNKKSRVSVDRKRTNDLWKRRPELRGKQFVYHTNEHSNGYRHRLRWVRNGHFKKSRVINCLSVRKFKRDFAKFIKENKGKIDYYTDNPI